MEDGTWNKAYCFVFITCTMGSVGVYIWRRPHLLTHREETLSNEIRGRTTVEMICRLKQ
jgi:hypothetical protein